MGRPKEVPDAEILAVARRCLLERGAAVSAVEIGRAVGVSHTTLFNRFGSKEGLMRAALGPPAAVPWVDELARGPDDRPLKEQLLALATAMSTYFQALHEGMALLRAAGVGPSPADHAGDSPPERAYRALVAWLGRARDQGRLRPCDVDQLAATLLGALQGWSFTVHACGRPTDDAANDRYVRGLIDLLWDGVAP